jgi:hypothetical protein
MKAMNREIALLTLLVLALFLPFMGCSTSKAQYTDEDLGYIPARFYDIMDIIELNVGFDSMTSIYVNVLVEPLALGAVGWYECEKFGMDGRIFGQWTEKRFEINLIDSVIRYNKTPNWGNRYLFNEDYSPHSNSLPPKDTFAGLGLLLFGGLGPFIESSAQHQADPEENLFYKRWGMTSRLGDTERWYFDIAAEVHLLFVGVEVGVSLTEIFDFATGILGIDAVANDDWVWPRMKRRPLRFYEEEESDTEATVYIGEEGK